ncbi:hypothetical protein HPP92_000258 [Vanilla planifolia]|uniref:Uncharacterized protein n=1 Tax=Vanilla planifolia TaxID=51239 RepID=A0A835S0Y6_VANPL|nr:hypothetical protein HPP92_000258 [Vanilla planifolia]
MSFFVSIVLLLQLIGISSLAEGPSPTTAPFLVRRPGNQTALHPRKQPRELWQRRDFEAVVLFQERDNPHSTLFRNLPKISVINHIFQA